MQSEPTLSEFTGKENRKSLRFSIVAPIWLRWYGNEHVEQCSGTTCNISSHGALFQSEKIPPVISAIEIGIDLSRAGILGVELRLRGEGTVVRVGKPGDDPTVVAAQIKFRIERETTSDMRSRSHGSSQRALPDK